MGVSAPSKPLRGLEVQEAQESSLERPAVSKQLLIRTFWTLLGYRRRHGAPNTGPFLSALDRGGYIITRHQLPCFLDTSLHPPSQPGQAKTHHPLRIFSFCPSVCPSHKPTRLMLLFQMASPLLGQMYQVCFPVDSSSRSFSYLFFMRFNCAFHRFHNEEARGSVSTRPSLFYSRCSCGGHRIKFPAKPFR